MMETHVRGGIVGPTFACIIALDFHNKKFGDRFYFETKDKKIRFKKRSSTQCVDYLFIIIRSAARVTE